MVEETKVTHDNNGRFYRIKMDLAKEGSEIWDLTPYFKGRVGDNRFGLQVVWTYQGRLLDTTGMKPYIEGNVGNYSFDDKKDLQLAPDAATVRYTGNPSDCQSGGRATYYFPEQMFPRDGIFKGYIGLLDDRDDSSQPHISGVTVWFRVLPGIAQMGHACDVYISDLDKALQNFQVKLDQHDQDYQTKLQQVIDDARNAYESETKNAHDSLDALKSQIQANRDEQENLAQHLAGTEQQIEIHDVVTRPEFLDLGNRLNQQVANLRQNKTLYFQDLAELKTQYPTGTDNLCITLNDKHLYVYDYANGAWTDAGITNIVTADPATKDAIYTDSANLAPDPDFKIMDGEWSFGCDLGSPNWAFESKTIDNSKVIQMHGYYNTATENNWNNSWCTSRQINVSDQKVVSVGCMINAKSAGQPEDARSELQILFYDKDGNSNIISNRVPESQDDSLKLFRWENITVPDSAVAMSFGVIIHGLGVVRFTKPQINFNNTLIPYSLKESIEHIQFIDAQKNLDNLVPNPNLINLDLWIVGADYDKTNYKTLGKINSSDVLRLYGHLPSGTGDNGNEWLTSSPFKVDDTEKLISQSWLARTSFDNPNAKSNNFSVGFKFFDKDMHIIGQDPLKLFDTNISDFQLVTFEGVSIPTGTFYSQVYIMVNGNGYVDLASPQVNTGANVLPYNKSAQLAIYDKSSKNLIKNSILKDLYHWNSGGDLLDSDIEVLKTDINGYGVVRLKSSDKDPNNDSDFGNHWLNSEFFEVDNYKSIAIEWLLDVRKDNPNDISGPDQIGIKFFDQNKSLVKDVEQNILANTNCLTSFNQKVDVPDGAKYAFINVIAHNKGYIDIACPRAFGAEKDADIISRITNNGESVTLSNDILSEVPRRVQNGVFEFDGYHSDKTENNWNNTYLNMGDFKVVPQSKFLSIDLQAGFNLTDNENLIRLEYHAQDEKGQQIYNAFKFFNQSQSIKHIFWEGLWVPEEAKTFTFAVLIQNRGTVSIKNFDYKFDDIYNHDSLPKIFIGNANDLGNDYQNATFRYLDGSRILDGFVKLSIQGDSSRNYPKKNFKTKFFSDEQFKNELNWKPKSNWDSNNAFNFKANWIDSTQSRNLCNAQLIKNAVEITPMEKPSETSQLLGTQGLGQMEGFPVEVFLADGFYGLFTLNTKKNNKSLLGISNDNTEAISSELNGALYRDTNAKIDGKNYSTEIHDQPSPTLETNFEKFVHFLNESDDETFVKNISNYIDVGSCINTMLFGILSKEYDYYSKSYLLCTWNQGSYFYMVPYDLDSTWNLYWDGSHLVQGDQEDSRFSFDNVVKNPDQDSFISNCLENKLFERIYKLFKSQIKTQYIKLRATVWSNSKIINEFKQFITSIPEEVYEKEQERWPDIPSKSITNFAQIQQAIIERGNAMDSFMEHFADSDTTSSQPATPTSPTTPQA